VNNPRRVIDCVGVWDTVSALGVPGGVFNVLNRRFSFHNTEIGHAVRHAYQALAIDEHRKSLAPAVWQKPAGWRGAIEQTWFVGAHSNIGSGYADHGLSDITLGWKAERAVRCGLDLDHDDLARIRFPTEHTPCPGRRWAMRTRASIAGLAAAISARCPSRGRHSIRVSGGAAATCPTTGHATFQTWRRSSQAGSRSIPTIAARCSAERAVGAAAPSP
jgi:hypothetical protein